jgi:hypothetical protein
MHPELNLFIRQFLGVVAMATMPVILTTFISLPFILGGHPGEMPVAEQLAYRHMT